MTGRGDRGVMEDLTRQYLREIGTYPLLTAAQEVELAAAIERGRRARDTLESEEGTGVDAGTTALLDATVTAGTDATRRFIQSNLRLVVSIAKRYQSCGLPLLDLVQEGNLGLMRAVDKFEHTRGCKFSTYATWWVRQSISRAIADKARTIRVPVHMLEAVRQVNRSTARLSEFLGREPTVEELAADADITVAAVLDARRLLPDSISLQEPRGDTDDAGLLGDTIEDRDAEVPFERAAASIRTEAVRAAIETLSEREQRVLTMRFGLAGSAPCTLEQVGQDFRLTRERIRQIEAKALTRLRHPASPPGLRALIEHPRPERTGPPTGHQSGVLRRSVGRAGSSGDAPACA